MFRLRIIALSVCSVFSLASCTSLSERASPPNPVNFEEPGPLDPEAMYRLGRYYQGQTRYVEAALAYREALKRNPQLADAHNGLGVSYAEQGRYDEAVEALKAAVALSPDAAYLHSNLGYALLLVGSNEEALNALERARTLDPTNENVLRNLKLAQQRLGRFNEQTSDGAMVAPANALGGQGAQVKLVSISPQVYELQTSTVGIASAGQSSPAIESRSSVAKVQASVAGEAKIEATTLEHQAARHTFRLEVSNGNGVRGLAKRVARFFDKHGIETSRVTNHKRFGRARTVVQFRPGYSAYANEVRAMLPHEHVPIVQSNALRSDIHVRVLLGEDLRTEKTLLAPDASVLMALQEHRQQ